MKPGREAGTLVEFYRDGAPDDAGRTLAEILAWPDERLEEVHDFIQWLFPLPERSGANPAAPTLDDSTIETFRTTSQMQDRLRASFERILRFYGLEWTGAKVDRAANFLARSQNWLHPMNHNHLRLTRILRSLRVLGLEDEAAALYEAIRAIYTEHPGRITERTFQFWSDAV